jgi:hypothetical protein
MSHIHQSRCPSRSQCACLLTSANGKENSGGRERKRRRVVACLAQGRELTLDQAVDLALDRRPDSNARPIIRGQSGRGKGNDARGRIGRRL